MQTIMITAIIQARVNSTRLPNKIFSDILGKPLIWHVVERIKQSLLIGKIVLATTLNKKDDIIEEWAKENQIYFYRGSEDDVLERYYETAKKYNATNIARITSDDPFKDPEIIDKVVKLFLDNNLDFAYNNNPVSFPEGLDTEVFSFKALERAHLYSREAFEREHVTQYFYRNPEKFSQKNLSCNENFSHLRWTMDTIEDLEMTRMVYAELYHENPNFRMSDILALLKRKPEIARINSSVKRSTMYNNSNTNE